MTRLVPAMLLAAVGLAVALAPAPAAPRAEEVKITWKKTVLDTKFRSEGVAVADVNKDGKMDVLNGEYWYEAPDWKPHEMQPFVDHAKNTENGLKGYSRVFACWADDINGDGWPDLIVIDFPGDAVLLAGEPQGQERGTGRSTSSGTPPATRRRSTPTSSARQAGARHGLPAAGQGERGADGLLHPGPEGPDREVGHAPDQRAEHAAVVKDGKAVAGHAARRSPARSGSATGSASATSTATSGPT